MKIGYLKWSNNLMLIIFLILTLAAEGGPVPSDAVAIPAGIVKGLGKTISVTEFYIDKYETTQQSYEKIVGENPSYFKGLNRPVERVNWFEATKYCARLKKRLPTEWEWELAAQLGDTDKLSEQTAGSLGWFKNNSELMTHPVGQKKKFVWLVRYDWKCFGMDSK